MKSMTGFGRSETETAAGRLIAEAKSENHRFVDVRVQLPENAGFLEAEIAANAKRIVRRGKVKITVVSEPVKKSAQAIDIKAARGALENLKALKKNLRLKGDITIDHVLSLAAAADRKPPAAKPDSKQAAQIRKSAAKAVEKMDESRAREGKALAADLTARASKCGRQLEKIKDERKKSEKEIKRKLTAKARSLIRDGETGAAGISQEIAAMLDKSDITEEIVRMNSHLLRFRQLLGEKKISVGKELDFLTQEMSREAATISAKSKSAAASRLAIDLRSEVEKMREQAQNAE